MISRYSLSYTKERLEKNFGMKLKSSGYKSRYNICPTQKVKIITQKSPNELISSFWGLIPHWTKRPNMTGNLFNADKNGISVKSSFRIPIREMRCLIPADSYYIFNKLNEPYRVCLKKQAMMQIAGVYDVWSDGIQFIHSFSMIIHDADHYTTSIHPKMPFILTEEEAAVWLNPETTLNTNMEILNRKNIFSLKHYRITNKVKDSQIDTPDLHDEISGELTLFDQL